MSVVDEAPTTPKISSRNDWFPIRLRVNKRPRKTDIFSQSWSYKFFRWPIFFFACWWIGMLFFVYIVVRFLIAVSELLISKPSSKLLEALNYPEYVAKAKKLDLKLGFDQWKKESEYYYYDYKTISKTLRNLRAETDIDKLMVILHNCVKSNFAGIENELLYLQTYFGTKNLIEVFNRQIIESLGVVLKAQIPLLEKYKFFKSVNKNYGRTALCLSGGATFAYTHLGIIKALVENDLLPSIISGTSGGGLIAALASIRTNEELKQMIIPELAYKITACEDDIFTWLPRWWKTGARFDAIDWARKCLWFTMGSLTFKEAYEKTGKILNISTVPSDPYSPVILCNHITSPNCVIWSALLASSAVPGILNPVVLMMKDRLGNISPFSFGNKWKDGSLRTDIPIESLNTYFNVKFSIVSQVNPHISFFYFGSKGSIGRPLTRRKGLRGGFIGSASENFLKLELRKWLKFCKELNIFPRTFDQDWSNVWLQRFSGTITLWPKMNFMDLFFILSDPTVSRLDAMIRKGELIAYPKMKFIKNRLDVERMISKGLLETKSQLFGGSEDEEDEDYNLEEDSEFDLSSDSFDEQDYSSASSSLRQRL